MRYLARVFLTACALLALSFGANVGAAPAGDSSMFCQHYVTPNPFSPNLDGVNDAQSFVFCLNESANVTVRITNYLGPVKTMFAKPFNRDGLLYNAYLAQGLNTFGWTGTDSSGRILPSGNYGYEITARNGAHVESVTGVSSLTGRGVEVVPTLEAELFELVNSTRREHGLAPLTLDERLRDVAREHSLDMRTNNYFAHVSPTEGSLIDRLNAAGLNYTHAGENLAAARPDAGVIHSLLMNSAPHRENILNPTWRKMGIGVAAGLPKRYDNPYESQTTEIFAE